MGGIIKRITAKIFKLLNRARKKIESWISSAKLAKPIKDLEADMPRHLNRLMRRALIVGYTTKMRYIARAGNRKIIILLSFLENKLFFPIKQLFRD